MNNKELIQLQNTQYQILCDVVDLCNKHSIVYYLFYGTLLGAIRHKGSIPWDCDIDIAMDAVNFEKFKSISNELPKKYEYKCVGAGDYNGLYRVYKKNTLIYHPKHGKENAFPIHIDVFKLENARKFSKLSLKIVNSLCRFLSIAKLNDYEKGWLYERFANNKSKIMIIKLGEALNKHFTEYQIEKCIHKIVISKKDKDLFISVQDLTKRFPIDRKEELRLEKYEDRRFICPNNTEELLKIMYGNYMEFPPEENRFTYDMEDLKIIF